MNVEGKRYVGGDFPVHLLTMGKLFNKRLVPCAFGIKIGLYFHVDVLPTARIGLLLPYHCCTESFNIPLSVSYVIAVSLLTNKSDFDKSIFGPPTVHFA